MIEKTETLTHQRRHATQWHQHNVGQLYWLHRGMMIVQTGEAQWALTPGTVGWFPANLPHAAFTAGEIAAKSMHLSSETSRLLPANPGIWAADLLLLLLLDKAMLAYQNQRPVLYQQHLLNVIVDEVLQAPALPLHIVLPADKRVRRIAEQMIAEPDCALSQQQLASQGGVSVRTLSRIFIQQTGLTFSQWRQQAKILASLEILLRGESVSIAANRCGYENVSAFIAAFKQRFMMTPGQFQSRNGLSYGRESFIPGKAPGIN